MSGVHFRQCADPGSCLCEIRRYALLAVISLLILGFQLAGVFLSGSYALLADTLHVGLDLSSHLISIVVALAVIYGSSDEKYRKFGGYMVSSFLALAAAHILYEAHHRWVSPPEIVTSALVLFGTLGMIGNLLQHLLIAADEYEQVTHRALSEHVKADLLQSIGVVGGGIAMWLTSYFLIDVVLSVLIAVFIFWQAVKLAIDVWKDTYQPQHACHDH